MKVNLSTEEKLETASLNSKDHNTLVNSKMDNLKEKESITSQSQERYMKVNSIITKLMVWEL